MKTLLSMVAFLYFIIGVATPARADIVIRLSVKAVLDPATGLRQPGVSDLIFSNTLAGVNALLASFGRGYRYEWVGNALIDVGGLGQFFTGPSQYYDVDFPDDPNGATLRQQFESNAIAHPVLYGWDATAANIYIVHMGGRTGGSSSSFPPDQLTLFLGNPPPGRGYSKIYTVIHELGHHFNLFHTHQGEVYRNSNNSTCTNQDCSCAKLIGGNDDLIADTIADHECWHSQDDIAQGDYGMNYADLTNARQAAVNRVWFNIMSYHEGQLGHEVNLFTSDQLDRWTDSANHDRPAEVSGRTWFVDRNNACPLPAGDSACIGGFGGPFQTAALGITVASGGDIVLIRPGHYNEPMTINKAVMLRATRGDALIGKP